ncbi:MAG TPA: hypothetical protein VIM89_06295 [Mucilaginibacter sp.]
MRRTGLITLCLAGSLLLGCSKSGVKPTPDQTPTSPKTAPDNYAQTHTDGASLFALWKPVTGYTSIYNQYGVLLGIDKMGVEALSQMQFTDATHCKITAYTGIATNNSYDLSTKDNTQYINFISDEGLYSYGIDTLLSNKLAISQITKYQSGNPYILNGKNYTVYETVLHFNFSQ